MHSNEVVLVRRASSNPNLLVPTGDLTKLSTAARKLGPEYLTALGEQIIRQKEMLSTQSADLALVA